MDKPENKHIRKVSNENKRPSSKFNQCEIDVTPTKRVKVEQNDGNRASRNIFNTIDDEEYSEEEEEEEDMRRDESQSSRRSKSKKEYERDKDVLSRRQKQIDYGYSTDTYKIYRNTVEKDERSRYHPSTPNKNSKYTRRGWDTLVKLWKRGIHMWYEIHKEMNDDDEENSEDGDGGDAPKVTADPTSGNTDDKVEVTDDSKPHEVKRNDMGPSTSVKRDDMGPSKSAKRDNMVAATSVKRDDHKEKKEEAAVAAPYQVGDGDSDSSEPVYDIEIRHSPDEFEPTWSSPECPPANIYERNKQITDEDLYSF